MFFPYEHVGSVFVLSTLDLILLVSLLVVGVVTVPSEAVFLKDLLMKPFLSVGLFQL